MAGKQGGRCPMNTNTKGLRNSRFQGLPQKSLFERRDGQQNIPTTCQLSISNSSILTSAHCSHCRQQQRRFALHVVAPGGAALAVCLKCLRKLRATESQENARRRFAASFTDWSPVSLLDTSADSRHTSGFLSVRLEQRRAV